MKKEKRFMYYRVSYSKSRDSFSTWIYVGEKQYPSWDDFGMELDCRCVRAYNDELNKPEDEANWIHYEVLTHIRQAMKLGYKVSFSDRPEEGDDE